MTNAGLRGPAEKTAQTVRPVPVDQIWIDAAMRDWASTKAAIAAAAFGAVHGHLGERGAPEHTVAAGELVQEYEVRAERASIEGQDVEDKFEQLEAQQRLRLVAIEAARTELSEHRDGIAADAHRTLGEELDLEEQHVRRMLREDGGS